MMDIHLRERLKRVIARRQWYVASWYVAGCWGLVALLGTIFYFVARQTAWSSSLTLPGLACGGLMASVWFVYRQIEGKIDYRDIATLNRYVSSQGKLSSGKRNGNTAFYQRQLALAVKRARYLALLPYVGE